MSTSLSSGPLRAVQWTDEHSVALRKSDGGEVDTSHLQGLTFTDPNAPNGGFGELVCSWQVNPLQFAVSGTAVAGRDAYPVPLSIPQAAAARSPDGTINFPAVYQAYNNTGQCRAATEIGGDATWTAVAFTPSLTPTSVSGTARIAEQSYTCTGITPLHRIVNIIPAAYQAGLRIIAFRCDANDTLKITYENFSGSNLTPTAGAFTVNTRLPVGGAQSSLFHTLGFWAKTARRADGAPYTKCVLQLFPDIFTITNRALATVQIRADGLWRFYVTPWAMFGSAGTFVLGASRFDYMSIQETGSVTAATWTGSLASGDVGATLSGAWAAATGVYPVRFSNNEIRHVQFKNGSTAASWSPALTSSATTAAVYSTTQIGQGATESVQIGPVYRNPTGRAFAYIRFDDCVVDQYTDRQTLSTPFVGASGVTLPTGAYSMRTVVSAFGLKANLFILTSCVGKPSGNFLTVAQMRELQDMYGWDVCFQTHANPASLGNVGGRLLGPYGYAWSVNQANGIASVDTTANTITTNAAHQFLTPALNLAGLQGQPIEMTGTNLPAPLTTGVQYWPRPTTTTSFKLYPTELDSANDTNAIDLTTTGTPANFGYRYWGSSPDGSAFLADVRTGQALMSGWGFKGGKHLALNQGGWDNTLLEAIATLRGTDEVRSVHGTSGSTGVPTTAGYAAVPGVGYYSSGGGFVPNGQFEAGYGDLFTFPGGFQSEAYTEQQSRDYVDSLVERGAIGGNYHHTLGSEASLRALCAYCDQIKLRVDQGVLLTGTMTDLWARLEATRNGAPR